MQHKNAPVLIIFSLIVGCQGTLPPPASPQFQGIELKVACPPGASELVQARSRLWADRQQAKVFPVEHRGEGLAQVDLQLLPPADVPRWAAAGDLVNLPDSLLQRESSFGWSGLLPTFRDHLCQWDRVLYALPLLGEAPVCVYRTDLYSNPETNARFRRWQADRKQAGAIHDLRLPVTWDQFANQAEFFASDRGKPSLPPLPPGDAEYDRLFYSIATNYARRGIPDDEPRGKDHVDEVFYFLFDQKSGEPRIDSPGFVAALDVLYRLHKCASKERVDSPELLFQRGEAVLCLTEAHWLPRFQKEEGLRDRFGVCPIPGSGRCYTAAGRWVTMDTKENRVPYLGAAGWLGVVPKTSKQQEAAIDLLIDVAGPVNSRQTALDPRWGAPLRGDHLHRDRWDSFDLDEGQSAALRETLNRTLLQYRIKNPVVSLRTPRQRLYREALVSRLRSALEKGTASTPALAEVRTAWLGLIEAQEKEHGKGTHLRDYRMSLGLLSGK